MTVTLATEDTACAPDMAATKASQVITDGVKFIIGDLCSGAAVAVSTLANQAGVLQITPTASNPSVTVNPYTFRAIFTDPVQGRAGAASQLRGWVPTRSLSCATRAIHTPADWRRLSQTRRGGAVRSYARIRDLCRWADRLLNASGPGASHGGDVIYLPSYPAVANLAVAQARQMSLGATFLGSDSWEYGSLDFEVTDGSYFTTSYSPEDPSLGAVAFRQAYQARFGHPP